MERPEKRAFGEGLAGLSCLFQRPTMIPKRNHMEMGLLGQVGSRIITNDRTTMRTSIISNRVRSKLITQVEDTIGEAYLLQSTEPFGPLRAMRTLDKIPGIGGSILQGRTRSKYNGGLEEIL
jgi:hypothetical protein